MITCDYASEKILTEELDESVLEHIASCKNCADLQEEWIALKDHKPFVMAAEPVPETDALICQAAREQAALAVRSSHRLIFRRFTFKITAIAAMLALMFTGLHYGFYASRTAPVAVPVSIQQISLYDSQLDAGILELSLELDSAYDALAATSDQTESLLNRIFSDGTEISL